MNANAPKAGHLEIPGRSARCDLARALIRLLDRWELQTEEQLKLLGLSDASTLSRYRHGEPIDPNRDLIERIGHLLGLHNTLESLFPNQPAAQRTWISSRKKSLGNRTPAEYVGAEGVTGLRHLRALSDEQMG